jgi:endonuclease YncB( thermonuclease family)
MPARDDCYVRRFVPFRAVDGDTLETLRVDLGFHQAAVDDIRFRLYGLNCPETSKRAQRAAGLAAKAYTEAWIAEHLHSEMYLICKTTPVPGVALQDSFGRYIAQIFCTVEEHPSLNVSLVRDGHAVPFMLL